MKLKRIIQRLKATPFYEFVRRFWLVYQVMDRRGRQMMVVAQANKILVALVGTLGTVVIVAFLITLGKPEIVLENRYSKAVYQALGFESSAYFLVFASGLLVLAGVFHQLITLFSSLLTIRLQEGVARRCTVILYRYYLSESYEDHIKRGVTGSVGKGLGATRGVITGEVEKMSGFMAAFINIVFIFGGLYIIHTQAMLIVMFTVTSAYITFFFIHKHRARVAGKEIFENQLKQVRLVREGAGAATEIKLMGKEREFTEQVQTSLVQTAKRKIQQSLITAVPQRVIWIISIFTLYTIAVYLLLGDRPQQTFTVLALFAAALFRLLPSMQRVFGMFMGQEAGSARFEAVMEDMKRARNRAIENEADKEKFHIARVRDSVVFDRVSYTYPEADEPIIRNLSFSLPADKIIALFGRSGVGKTTVIRLLSGLLFPQKGRVLVDGQPLQEGADFTRNWQKSSSFVFQKPFFMDTTMAMNIAFEAAEDKVDYERLRKAVKLAQLEDLVESLPDGLDTKVEEDAEILSGGQRQRLAIARALYKDSSVLILDEATNSLDLVVEKRIIRSLMDVSKDKMIIIIAHRPDTMRFADVVLVMKEDGSVVQGSYDELIARDADFRTLAGTVKRARAG